MQKEAKARVKVNELLQASGWRFFDSEKGKANIVLENALRDPLTGEIGKSIIFCLGQKHASKKTRILNEYVDRLLWHYFSLFLAKKSILLMNHPGSNDPTPDEADRKLMRALQADSHVLSFKSFFSDLIFVAKKSYFSMATNDGTACHCGHQEYIPE